ncbi:MAG TPA: MBL fold metallo-hydrolase, partial [Polyangia bacterium]
RRGDFRLARVLVTHAHPAHAGSAARVARGTGVRVFVHADDAPFLDGTREPLLPSGRRGQLMAALGRVVDLCPPVYRLEPLPLDGVIAGLRVVPTPGHTPGHVCFWHEEDGALLSGDALVVEAGEPALPASSLSHDPVRARTTLSALRGLPVRHLLPGHGPPLLDDAGARVAALLDRLDA